MTYMYNAALYCDSCGQLLVKEARRNGDEDYGDSDGFPQSVLSGETDSPSHCDSREECLEPLDLTQWGLDIDDPLYGAESRVIGALIDERLTEDGVSYLKEMLDEPAPTPYQRALHDFWRAAYADYL